MSRVIAYGVSVRNATEEAIGKSQNISRQELASIGYYNDEAIVEIVRSGDSERPLLDKIIDEFTSDDLIVLYSINTLFKGKNNRGLEFYSKIINKGIPLLICDFSGNVARISKYSTFSPYGTMYQFDKLELVRRLEQEMFDLSAVARKKIKENLVFDLDLNEVGLDENNILANRKTKAFIDIYFAYENYQLQFETTLNLLKKYCDISTAVTFRRLVADFERSYYYKDKFEEFCEINGRGIVAQPKRCGGVPDEYYEINAFVDSLCADIPKSEKVELAIKELRLLTSKDIYARWDLSASKKAKPRTEMSAEEMKEFVKKLNRYSNM